MLHKFVLAGKNVRLWQKSGETYEHILMKALAYAMFVGEYPNLEIEVRVGLRYKPDLIAVKPNGAFAFWGECGLNTIRKTAWLLKHSGTEKLVLFKIGFNVEALIKHLRREIPKKYRAERRLILINFIRDIKSFTQNKKIEKVSRNWFDKFVI